MYKGVFVHWKTGEVSRVTISANNMASLKRKASGCMNKYSMPFDIMMVTAPSGTMFKMIRANKIYPDGTNIVEAAENGDMYLWYLSNEAEYWGGNLD